MAVTTPTKAPRTEPAMTSSHPRPVPCHWFSWLAAALDRRTAPQLALLFLGAVLNPTRATGTATDEAGERINRRLDPDFVRSGRRIRCVPWTGTGGRLPSLLARVLADLS